MTAREFESDDRGKQQSESACRVSAVDGTELHATHWSRDDARFAVGIVHGFAEHGGRYGHVAAALQSAGAEVVAIDLRGHGRSAGRRGHVDRFSDYGRDVDALADLVRERGRPWALIGHSMGGLVVCDWLLRDPSNPPFGVVLSSPFLGLDRRAAWLQRRVVRLLSAVAPGLTLAAEMRGDQVCRDPRLQRAYDADPYRFKRTTVRWASEALCAIDRVQARVAELSLPLLLLYAGADSVVQVAATDSFARGLRSDDLEVERFDGYYHEIFNEREPERQRVLDRMTSWLRSRVGNTISGEPCEQEP